MIRIEASTRKNNLSVILTRFLKCLMAKAFENVRSDLEVYQVCFWETLNLDVSFETSSFLKNSKKLRKHLNSLFHFSHSSFVITNIERIFTSFST